MAATTTTARVATGKTGGKPAAAAEVPAAPAKPKSRMKLVIVAVLVLALAGGGYVMFTKKPAKAGPPKPGTVIAMDATTLNLADGHFLKIKLGLQTIAGKKGQLDTSKAADIMISEFTNRPMASLATEKARDMVKATLLKKLEAAYPDEIMGVYFTQFVMQ